MKSLTHSSGLGCSTGPPEEQCALAWWTCENIPPFLYHSLWVLWSLRVGEIHREGTFLSAGLLLRCPPQLYRPWSKPGTENSIQVPSGWQESNLLNLYLLPGGVWDGPGVWASQLAKVPASPSHFFRHTTTEDIPFSLWEKEWHKRASVFSHRETTERALERQTLQSEGGGPAGSCSSCHVLTQHLCGSLLEFVKETGNLDASSASPDCWILAALFTLPGHFEKSVEKKQI